MRENVGLVHVSDVCLGLCACVFGGGFVAACYCSGKKIVRTILFLKNIGLFAAICRLSASSRPDLRR
jgi:hypothetical protein